MKTFVLVVAAMLLVMVTPSASQEFRLRDVDVGVGERHRGDGWRRDREVYRLRGVRPLRSGCKTVVIHRDDGVTKKIQRCAP